MANTLNGMTRLIIIRAMQRLMTEHPVLSKIARDFSTAGAQFGETIKARVFNNLTAANAIVAGKLDLSPQDSASTLYPVTIDQAVKVGVHVDALELSKVTPDDVDAIVEEQAAPMASALADAIMANLFGNINADDITNEFIIADGAGDRGAMNALAVKMTNRKVPKFGRYLLTEGDLYKEISDDIEVVGNNTNPQSNQIFSGILPDVSGFSVSHYSEIPTAENLRGIAGTPDGLVVASRIPTNVMELAEAAGIPTHGLVETVVEPVTGLAVQLHSWYVNQTTELNRTLLCMFGTGLGDVRRLERVVSAAT